MELTSRFQDASSFLLGAWKARPRGRRALRMTSILLLLSGAGMLSYPFFTDLYSAQAQTRLASEFEAPELRSLFQQNDVPPGGVLTRMRIPKLDVDTLIVEGTDPGALRAGAGHYLHTSLPCQAGNAGIAGHRTTYGKPFHRIDELVVGDIIELQTPNVRCTYRVVAGPDGTQRPRRNAAGWITHPNDGAVIGPIGGDYVTLTTCHPKGSAAKRLIVRAILVDVSNLA